MIDQNTRTAPKVVVLLISRLVAGPLIFCYRYPFCARLGMRLERSQDLVKGKFSRLRQVRMIRFMQTQ